MGAFTAAAIALAINAGVKENAPTAVGGIYTAESETSCFGSTGSEVTVAQSGDFIEMSSHGHTYLLHIAGNNQLLGTAECAGSSSGLALHRSGKQLVGTFGSAAIQLDYTRAIAALGTSTPIQRSSEETFGRLALAVAVVIIFARLAAAGARRLGQPKVMGEVMAGILLGPTLLGAVAPSVQTYIFPSDIIPLISGAADIGLAFFMFLVGLEFDIRLIKGRISQAALISNVGIALPLVLGFAAAVPLYSILGPTNKTFLAFSLFLALSLSITAFPVLARLLVEKRMLRTPVGALSIAAAAIDDVSAWGLLALASAFALATSRSHALLVVVLAIAFCVLMALAVRPLLARVAVAYDEAGTIPDAWVAIIFGGILLSAFVTEQIGVASIFGAFVLGMVMPRHGELTRALTTQIEQFVVAVLLPLFFVVVGLKTNIGLLDRPELWLIAGSLLALAIIGKWFGVTAAGLVGGLRVREAAVVGSLMNTRGLTELIVLNIGFDLGVLNSALFAALVLMALVTTFMTAPLLRLVDPKRTIVEGEDSGITVAVQTTRAILVAFQDERHLDSLLAIAEPLTRAVADRELIIVQLLEPSGLAHNLSSEDFRLQDATSRLSETAQLLRERVVAVRTAAFLSPDPGADIVKLAGKSNVDLLLVEGRRPLLGSGVPRGAVGTLLADAPCDVAVLVERADAGVALDAARTILVPFGGTDHDWTALELAAMVASQKGIPLQLLGATATGQDASRLLASASLVIQRLTGVQASPLLAEPGRDGVIAAAAGSGLIVVGLSDRWRSEGVGPVRAEIARMAPAATLFVRRGARAGALSGDSETRFSWSRVSTRNPNMTPDR
jgi:Kef-type K+ transport system membrane component KefB